VHVDQAGRQVPATEVDRTAGQLVRQNLSKKLSYPGGAQARDREFPLRTDDRGKREVALPIELLVRFAACVQEEVSALGCRLELLQVEGHGIKSPLERLAARAVEKVHHAAVYVEVRDPDPGWLVVLALRGRRTRGQIGEVHRAVRADDRTDIGQIHVDLTKIQRALPQRGKLEVHEQPLETQHPHTVRVGKGEVVHFELQLEGMDADLAERELPAILGADVVDRLVAHDAWRDLEAE